MQQMQRSRRANGTTTIDHTRKTLADIYRLRAEGLSLRQIERKLRLAKSTVYDALHPERVRSLREAKLEAAAQSSKDRRAEGLAFWHSMMSKIPDEA
jgi:transposase-like protein